LGDDGHGASRESLTPKLVGLVPAQEKIGMAIKLAAMIRSAGFKIDGNRATES
jgi:hypothetical protein